VVPGAMFGMAVAESGIPFKPTAYQLRHPHASWLIGAGENAKAVMHRLGHCYGCADPGWGEWSQVSMSAGASWAARAW
jgi:hypothetical protein